MGWIVALVLAIVVKAAHIAIWATVEARAERRKKSNPSQRSDKLPGGVARLAA